jgi:2-polyprenyl-3-methyl-5-hydroxy-6-metoxy-1,4-benzoquinol methylase
MLYNDVLKNEFGFYTLKKLPSDEERENYYKEKYYQESKSTYSHSYTEDELNFFRAKLEQKLLLINEHFHNTTQHNTTQHNTTQHCCFLDVGCGEGYALAFFKERGFDVLGLDYSDAGIKNHNSGLLNNVIVGDLYDSINDLIENSKRFDIINMDNLLEHVTNPKCLMESVYKLLKENGIVIIKVPNDFSVLQKYLWDHGIIKKVHWVAPLDHISYFNKDGLVNLCKSVGLDCLDILGDQLIEFSALNPNTNYFENKAVGKSCHFARIAQENIFHNISPSKTIELFRIFGEMGLGREIIGVFGKGNDS